MEQASGHGQRDCEVHDPARRNAQKRAARKRQRECSARQRRRTSRADDAETQPAARRLFESNARGSLEFSIPMKQIIAAGALELFALSTDGETVAIAKTIGQVLWDDLNYEREFGFIPRDVYASIPKATSFADVPFDRWRELNAD